MLFKLITVISLLTLSLNSWGSAAAYKLATEAYNEGLKNAMINTGVEGENKKICSSPGGQWACPIALMAGVMVVTSLLTAKKAKGIENELDCAKTDTCFSGAGNGNYGSGGDYGGPGLDPRNPIDREIVRLEKTLPEIKKNIKDLENKGYKVNPDGSVTSPNGSTLSSMTPSGMKKAGMTPDQIDAAVDIMEQAKKKRESLLSQLNEYDEEYSGGGGSGGKNGYDGQSADNASSRFGNNRMPSNSNEPSIAGLSVKHGGDQIGVAGDNLFKMVHRKYEEKKPSMATGGP